MSEIRPPFVDIDALTLLRREVSDATPAIIQRLERDLLFARNTDTWCGRSRSPSPADVSREATRKISTYMRFR